MNPLISIIIPVYNVEKYLGKCLDTIINQTYKNLEIICVNDGSEDNSLEILNNYGKKDSRIKVILQENNGLSSARNTGVENSVGEYIMFVDSDDWIDLETCEQAVNAAQKCAADVVFWSYVREFEGASKEKLLFWDDGEVFEKEDVKTKLFRRMAGLYEKELSRPDYANALETAWGKLYKADIIKKNNVKFVDTKEIGTEDTLFNLYAYKYVEKAVYLRKCYYHYRKTNDTSLTSKYNSKLYSRWQNLFSMMRNFIKENNLPEDFDAALNNRIAISILGLGLNILDAEVSSFKKISMINEIISSDLYRNAYKTLTLKYFPIHWKAFYFCAKHRIAFGVYILCKVIKKIIYRK